MRLRRQGREGDFYNVSSGSDEVDSNGFPHAWFHSSLPSHPEGFPLVRHSCSWFWGVGGGGGDVRALYSVVKTRKI